MIISRYGFVVKTGSGLAEVIAQVGIAGAGVLAGFDIQDGRAAGFLTCQLMHEVITSEKAQGQQLLIVGGVCKLIEPSLATVPQ